MTLLLSFATLAVAVFSQNHSFKKGQKELGFGIGFISSASFDIEGYDLKTKVPPISFTYDIGITDDISLGAYLGYAKQDAYTTLTNFQTGDDYYGHAQTLTHTIIGGRAIYHQALYQDFDTYVGVMLGFDIQKQEYVSDAYTSSSTDKAKTITYAFLVGAKYKFNEHLGAFGELGYGVSILNLGLKFKL